MFQSIFVELQRTCMGQACRAYISLQTVAPVHRPIIDFWTELGSKAVQYIEKRFLDLLLWSEDRARSVFYLLYILDVLPP